MEDLSQLVEQAEREAAELEGRAREVLAHERARLEEDLAHGQRRIEEKQRQLEQLSLAVTAAQRAEAASRARLESTNPPTIRAPLRGRSVVAGAVVCWTLLGFTAVFGGCWVAPVALLAGRLGRDID